MKKITREKIIDILNTYRTVTDNRQCPDFNNIADDIINEIEQPAKESKNLFDWQIIKSNFDKWMNEHENLGCVPDNIDTVEWFRKSLEFELLCNPDIYEMSANEHFEQPEKPELTRERIIEVLKDNPINYSDSDELQKFIQNVIATELLAYIA